MNIEGTIGFVTSSSSRNLIEDCLHEDIYCGLPVLGLRANDALTQSLTDLTTRTETNCLFK